MQIYLARNNVQAGPYGLDEVNQMLSSGEVALTDLMWHEGMTSWQAVGEMTGGRLIYLPTSSVSEDKPVQNPTSFGDNVDFRKKEEGRRVTVAELYGKKPIETDKTTTEKPIAPKKPEPEPEAWMGRHRTKQKTIAPPKDMVYASVMTRLLATCINMLLLFLAFLPFVQAMLAAAPDADKLNTGDFAVRMAYAQELAAKINPVSANMTLMLVIGLLLVQVIMLVRRGQSLGKLAVGIRVVSERTGKLPDAGVLIGVRGALLVLIYWLASAVPFVSLQFILLGVNYFMASNHPKKQGWHDRLAKTMIVKAHPSQLDK